MEAKIRNSVSAYALGFVALVLAVLVRWLLDPLMGDAFPLVTLFGAVAAAVDRLWMAGRAVCEQRSASCNGMIASLMTGSRYTLLAGLGRIESVQQVKDNRPTEVAL